MCRYMRSAYSTKWNTTHRWICFVNFKFIRSRSTEISKYKPSYSSKFGFFIPWTWTWTGMMSLKDWKSDTASTKMWLYSIIVFWIWFQELSVRNHVGPGWNTKGRKRNGVGGEHIWEKWPKWVRYYEPLRYQGRLGAILGKYIVGYVKPVSIQWCSLPAGFKDHHHMRFSSEHDLCENKHHFLRNPNCWYQS